MLAVKEYFDNLKLVWRSRNNRLKNLENLSLKDKLEAEFYDRLALNRLEDITNAHFQYDPNEGMPSRYRYLYSQLSDVGGKKVLDLCCGFGENSVRLAKLGAEVHSIDISRKMLDVTRENSKHNRVGRDIIPVLMSAQEIAYRENQFDYIVGLGALHHLNLGKAGKELWRVLKPGGVGLFLEPRVPFSLLVLIRGLLPIKCYESPGGAQLKNNEITNFTQLFSSAKMQYFMLFEKLIRLPIIQSGGRMLEEIDMKLARIFPELVSLYWSVVIRVVK